jgi:hypothetical protein
MFAFAKTLRKFYVIFSKNGGVKAFFHSLTIIMWKSTEKPVDKRGKGLWK